MSELFSPITIGGITLPNRFVHSATQENMADSEGRVLEALINRYSNLARGEVGLIITGHMAVHPHGVASPGQTGIWKDEHVSGLSNLVKAVENAGGLIAFQLSHAGRQTHKSVIGRRPMGPSAKVIDPNYFFIPKAMSESDIEIVIEAFGRAAARAAEAGAHAVQLHAAHGYLLNQFLSPYFNRRTDKWGGSDENRFRLFEAVYLRVRDVLPKELPILVKLNGSDYSKSPGITPELASYYAARMRDLGVDALEISGGTSFSFMNICRGEVPVGSLLEMLPWWQRPAARLILGSSKGKFDLVEGYHQHSAEIVKPALGDIPLIQVGGWRTKTAMENALQSGLADLISMSRPFIREPFLVKRFREGRADAAACVSCNRCFATVPTGKPLRCHWQG